MNDLIICKYNRCKKYLLDPVLLPCSNSVCKAHIEQIKGYDTFKCLACENEHETPRDGFIVNSFINKIFDYIFHFNDNAKRSAESLSRLKEDIKKFEDIVHDPQKFIYENISFVRNKIDSERLRLIDEVNSLSNEMFDQLQKYENECKEHLNKMNNLTQYHKTNLIKISNQMLNMKEELRIPNIDVTRINELLEQSNQLVDEIERKYLDYKNSLLLNKECSFNAMNTRIDQKLFGQLLISNMIFYELSMSINLKSSLLTSFQCAELIKLCEFDHQAQFNLLYQASKDGFTSENFYDKCDQKPNTLTIIKVKGNSNVFGGFCSVSWDKSCCFRYDDNAFLFSLINKDNHPLKIKVTNPFTAILCKKNLGPTFGCDIHISNNSNLNEESYSDFGHSYESSLYPYDTNKAKNFLAGSFNFTTEEIEVFQVTNLSQIN